MKILVIIPAYNEEESILEVIKEIREVFPDFKILVVDDGSRDKTAERCRENTDFLISLPFHLGLGVALQTGYIFAKENNYDYVIHFDADGQHVAEEIEKLLIPVRDRECDLAVGSRYLNKNSLYNHSRLRVFATKVISKIFLFFLKKEIKDPTSGFRVMNRRVVSLFTQQYPHDYPEIEELIILIKNNLRIKEIPVNMRPRIGGKSSLTFTNSLFYIFKFFLILCIDLFRPVKIKET